MSLTTGEQITSGLKWYLNQGSPVVVEDRDWREKAWFLYSKVARRVWNSAPYWFRKANGVVTLTNGVGDMPADFSRIGTQGQIYIQGSLYRVLTYKPPDWILFQIENSPQTGTPWYYTLYVVDSAKQAAGTDQILCWPSDNSTLNVQGYDRKLVEMIDAPTACNPTVGAAGALTGTYTYKVTFVTARGETEGGTTSAPVTVASQNISVDDIPTWWGRNVTSRKLYRTAAGGSQHKLVTTIVDNTTTSYTDSTLDGALGADVPTVASSVSGTEVFPDEFHDSTLWEGLVYLLARSQGDNRDVDFKLEWDRAVQRMWEEIQQGQNQINAFPPFPGFISGHPVWGRWTPPS